MKRSEVNKIITGIEEFFAKHQFKLPEWAAWGPEDWKGKYEKCSEIVDNKLGWDITDFGSGDLRKSDYPFLQFETVAGTRKTRCIAKRSWLPMRNKRHLCIFTGIRPKI
jgi:D-lyxose ketol-isomerase